MTRLTANAAAHGQTAGTALTGGSGGNTVGLGSYFDAITLAGTGAVTFQGTDLVRFADAAGASNVARADWTSRLNGTVFSVELEINAMPAPGGGEQRILEVRNVGNTASVVRVQVQADRTIRVYDGGGTLKWTSTTALPTGAGSRIWVGGTISTGTVNAAIYTATDGKSSTAADSSGAVTGFTWGGATNVGGLRVGSITSAADATWDMRNVRIDDATSAAMGALTSSPVVIDPTAPDTAGINLTGKVSGGTSPYALAGTQLAGASVGTISSSGLVGYFAKPTSGAVTVRWTVTDNVGATVTVDRQYSAVAAGGPKVWDGTSWV